MGVKIVGKDEGHVKRTTCRHCASILEYTLSDTTTRLVSDYTGDSDRCRFLVCPQCRQEIQVKMY